MIYSPNSLVPRGCPFGMKRARSRVAFPSEKACSSAAVISRPASFSMSDAAIAAKQCDGAILVIESEAVSRRDAMKAKEQLTKSGCKLLGAVLNKVDMKKEKYYSKYNSYYYGKSKQELRHN